jgi:hypothetical protein
MPKRPTATKPMCAGFNGLKYSSGSIGVATSASFLDLSPRAVEPQVF